MAREGAKIRSAKGCNRHPSVAQTLSSAAVSELTTWLAGNMSTHVLVLERLYSGEVNATNEQVAHQRMEPNMTELPICIQKQD